MNLSFTYSEIQSFIRKNYYPAVSLSSSAFNTLTLIVPVTTMGKTVSFPFFISVENNRENKLRFHINSSMEGINDLLRGGLTVIHNNIFPFVNQAEADVIEIDLENIPQLSSVTKLFRITSLNLLQTEVSVNVLLK